MYVDTTYKLAVTNTSLQQKAKKNQILLQYRDA